MNPPVIRQLLVDLNTAFALRWNGGDAFTSAFMNALSLSFPAGEQFFLDSVREGLKQLPAEQQELFKSEVKGFIGQEATHRRLHALFNRHLLDQGLVNHWEQRSLQRIADISQLDVRHALGVTAATEHFTAVFAHWLLSHEDFFQHSLSSRHCHRLQ
jgi:predicted metal-dependent hydrolase